MQQRYGMKKWQVQGVSGKNKKKGPMHLVRGNEEDQRRNEKNSCGWGGRTNQQTYFLKSIVRQTWDWNNNYKTKTTYIVSQDL